MLCGREEVKLIDRLCTSCYIKTREIIKTPKAIEVITCKVCGSRKFKGRWVQFRNDLESEIEEEVLSSISLDKHVEEYHSEPAGIRSDRSGTKYVVVKVTGSIEGEKFDVEREIPIKIESVLCPSCVKRRGKYYEVIVQLRSKSGSISLDEKQFFESFFSNEDISNLSDVMILKEGIDYYFMNRAIAKRLVSKFTSEVKVETRESYQRERIKRGKREAKLVISLRL
ncbi:MAG: 60S ribosomal export protein NMD3 [Metallosphaera sp.]